VKRRCFICSFGIWIDGDGERGGGGRARRGARTRVPVRAWSSAAVGATAQASGRAWHHQRCHRGPAPGSTRQRRTASLSATTAFFSSVVRPSPRSPVGAANQGFLAVPKTLYCARHWSSSCAACVSHSHTRGSIIR
jgi:hypothetical protein